MIKQNELLNIVLRLGDTALLHGQRLSEWTGKGPILEEDLALTNIALDYLGRATLLLKYAAELEGNGRSEDDMAFKRHENEYHNALMVELPIGNFADTIAKQLILSCFDDILFDQLKKVNNEKISEIAYKAHKEILYHKRHAKDWTIRLGLGTTISNSKMQEAIQTLWMYIDNLFDIENIQKLDLADGTFFSLEDIKSKFKIELQNILNKATIKLPDSDFSLKDIKQGVHTEYLGHLLTEMQFLHRAYPEARWV